jgi:arylsulfatase A-like enzyme
MSPKSNFLIIIADDLGFSDVGCFGSEIKTPNLDSIGRGGIRFQDFHAAAACSPTRAMLLSGTDHHLTGLGQLVEFTRNSPAHQGKPGHEGYLTDNVATLPEVLRDGGYHTIMSGKWHLGLRPEYSPSARGFNKSFSLLPGCANHYGWEPQLAEETDQPKFFDTAVAALHIEDTTYVDNSELPEDFYSTDHYTSKLLEYLEDRPKEKPFFAYLPYSAPHWPLQAPEENMEPYKGLYNEGPDALRLKRLDGLIREGLTSKDVKPHPVTAPGSSEWHDMDDISQAKSAKSMEAYAGMVDRMDQNIGKVLNYLKENDLYDNTVILFASDNGAEGASYELMPVVGDEVVGHIEKYYNNSLENIGRKDSFVWYGSRWAQAATAPSRLFKMFSTEGGVRVPLIMKLLGTRKPFICNEFCTMMDIMPTLLELAGIPKPSSFYNGRSVLSMRGSSWVPYLSGVSDHIHDDEYVTGWELVGQGALRKGHWKINFVAQPYGSESWQLFDMSKDPGETTDLSDQEPEKLKELIKHWEQYALETQVVGLRPELGTIVVKDEMEDPKKWMQFETSSGISRSLKKTKATITTTAAA